MEDPIEPIVGVLGGMGPKATVHFVDTIISLTKAKRDQDHLRMIINNDPTVPDRTAHLLGEGPTPLPALLQMAHHLERSGANLLVMPCNTAHAYLPALKEAVNIPFLNMVKITAATAAQRFPKRQTIALLATRGTILSGVYQQALREQEGPELLLPDPAEQAAVQAAIEWVKSGRIAKGAQQISPVVHSLQERGALAFVLGCSEIPLITGTAFPELTVIDATRCLASETITRVRQLKRTLRSP